MSAPINIALYRLLVKQGADASEAAEAARIDTNDLATKGDITELRLATKADLAELKADLTKVLIGTMIALTAIYGGLVATLKLFA